MSYIDTVKEQNDTNVLRSFFCSPSELDRSYKRCSLLGIPIGLAKPRILLAESAGDSRIERNWFLISVTERVLRPDFYNLPEQIIFVLCDSQLAVLKLSSVTETLSVAKEFGIVPGAVLSEESFGTNALALSKEYRRLLALHGRYHYCEALKNWSSVASPVTDSKGSPLGYLGLSVYQDDVPWFAGIILDLVVSSIERQLKLIYPNQPGSVLSETVPMLSKGINELTKREKEVLNLKVHGLSNDEIASELSLSSYTVATHCRNIYSKLGVKNILKCMYNNR